MLSNYHTHSRYCDGKGELEEYVAYALSQGFDALGFSGHAPVPFANNFAIKENDFNSYCDEVRALKSKYAGQMDIRLGLEIDYIPGLLDTFVPLIEGGKLEYFIGSVHLLPHPTERETIGQLGESAGERLWFIDGSRQETYDEGLQKLFHGDIREGVKAYFYQNNEMIEQMPRWASHCKGNNIAIVGHVDKIVMHNRERYFRYEDRWFLDLLYETLELIAETGCICEINTRGLYKCRHTDFYPSRKTIEQMKAKHIPVIVSTDAHAPTDLTRFEGAYEMLHEMGYRDIITHL